MINKTVLKALNEQFEKELFSSNLYLSMSVYFSANSLNGFANWMRIQSKEEMDHAMLIFDYILQRGGEAIVPKIEAPEPKWKSTLEVVSETYKHEQFITESINNLYSLANEQKDYATCNFLQWFIKEQVEEEENTSELEARVKLCDANKSGIFMIDNELKSRVHTPIDITQI